MEENFCPLCGSNQFSFFLESKGLNGNDCTLLSCRNCGLVRTKEIEGNEYPAWLNYNPGNIRSLFNRIEFYYIRMRWRRERRFVKKFIKEDALLLDVGSGSALFLNECRNMKIEAEGIEKHIDLKFNKGNYHGIYQLDVESDPLPENRYDCVTLYHSLEHMREPSMVLRKIRNTLKNNGILLIQVPNIDSWQFRAFKGRWFHLFLPYHTFHFSRETLTKMLKKHGFSIISIRHFSNRWNAEGWSASILKWNPIYFLRERAGGRNAVLRKCLYFLVTIMFIPLSFLESIFKKGGVITVIARKVS